MLGAGGPSVVVVASSVSRAMLALIILDQVSAESVVVAKSDGSRVEASTGSEEAGMSVTELTGSREDEKAVAAAEHMLAVVVAGEVASRDISSPGILKTGMVDIATVSQYPGSTLERISCRIPASASSRSSSKEGN